MEAVTLVSSTPPNGAVIATTPDVATTTTATVTATKTKKPAKVKAAASDKKTKKPAKVKAAASDKKAKKPAKVKAAKVSVPRLASAKRVKVQTQLYPSQAKWIQQQAKANKIDIAEQVRRLLGRVPEIRAAGALVEEQIIARAAKLAKRK
jgi:hypothetical protein